MTVLVAPNAVESCHERTRPGSNACRMSLAALVVSTTVCYVRKSLAKMKLRRNMKVTQDCHADEVAEVNSELILFLTVKAALYRKLNSSVGTYKSQ